METVIPPSPPCKKHFWGQMDTYAVLIKAWAWHGLLQERDHPRQKADEVAAAAFRLTWSQYILAHVWE